MQNLQVLFQADCGMGDKWFVWLEVRLSIKNWERKEFADKCMKKKKEIQEANKCREFEGIYCCRIVCLLGNKLFNLAQIFNISISDKTKQLWTEAAVFGEKQKCLPHWARAA